MSATFIVILVMLVAGAAGLLISALLCDELPRNLIDDRRSTRRNRRFDR